MTPPQPYSEATKHYNEALQCEALGVSCCAEKQHFTKQFIAPQPQPHDARRIDAAAVGFGRGGR